MISLSHEELAAFVDQLSVSQQDDLYNMLLVRRAQRRPVTAEQQEMAMDVISVWLAIRNKLLQSKDTPNDSSG